MKRAGAVLGSAIFLVVAPGMVAVYVPWMISHWHFFRLYSASSHSDAELIECLRFFATRIKIVVEPTGCLGFAAVRAHGAGLKGQRAGLIVSGGNVDVAQYAVQLAG